MDTLTGTPDHQKVAGNDLIAMTDFPVEVVVRGGLLLDAADELGLPASEVLEMTRQHLQREQRRALENPKVLRSWVKNR